ncbi:unnamed protein product [Parajaminaea phylloscopi]
MPAGAKDLVGSSITKAIAAAAANAAKETERVRKVEEHAIAIRKTFEELSRGGIAATCAAGTLLVEIADDEYEVPLPGSRWVNGPATLGVERVVRGAEYRKMAGPFGAGAVASAWVDRWDPRVGGQPLDLSRVVMEEGGDWDDLLVALADCAVLYEKPPPVTLLKEPSPFAGFDEVVQRLLSSQGASPVPAGSEAGPLCLVPQLLTGNPDSVGISSQACPSSGSLLSRSTSPFALIWPSPS